MTPLAGASLLRDRGIDLRTATVACGLDLSRHVVQTTTGAVPFDELVVATGCRPRHLQAALPPHATYLRTKREWELLRGAVQRGGRLVVVGAGFLGLEVAAAAIRQGMEVSVIDVAARVLQRGMARNAAEAVAAKHRAEGVDLRLGVTDPTLSGDSRNVWIDGVEGDFAVVSIGAQPAVEWLAGAGVPIDNGIICTEGLQVAAGLWAIGDCARWRHPRYGSLHRVEHWTTATQHARHVARSIVAGTATPFTGVPYVWSDQYEWTIQSVGVPEGKETHYESDDGAHVVVCAQDDQVIGVTTINAQAQCIKARQLLSTADPGIGTVYTTLGLSHFNRVDSLTPSLQ